VVPIGDVSADQRLDRSRVSSEQLGDVADGEAEPEEGENRGDDLGAGHNLNASVCPPFAGTDFAVKATWPLSRRVRNVFT